MALNPLNSAIFSLRYKKLILHEVQVTMKQANVRFSRKSIQEFYHSSSIPGHIQIPTVPPLPLTWKHAAPHTFLPTQHLPITASTGELKTVLLLQIPYDCTCSLYLSQYKTKPASSILECLWQLIKAYPLERTMKNLVEFVSHISIIFLWCKMHSKDYLCNHQAVIFLTVCSTTIPPVRVIQ